MLLVENHVFLVLLVNLLVFVLDFVALNQSVTLVLFSVVLEDKLFFFNQKLHAYIFKHAEHLKKLFKEKIKSFWKLINHFKYILFHLDKLQIHNINLILH